MAPAVVLTAAAVIFVALFLPAATQNATYDPWNPYGMANASTCHVAPWARVNPDTPNDDPYEQICPCDYPYHQKQKMCCMPYGQQEGQGPESAGPYYGVVAPYFYGAAGPSVEPHKSTVSGKLLCPCGYKLNTTNNICYTVKSGQYEDHCPCGTTKSPKNLACYDDPAAAANGTEEWGECVSSAWGRSLANGTNHPNIYRVGDFICPCGYYYNMKPSTSTDPNMSAVRCCKLKGARASFYYSMARDLADGNDFRFGSRVHPHGLNGQKLCPCGYFLDDSDNYCYSMRQYKYEDPCACGWAKREGTRTCGKNDYPNIISP
jgi:hypothetical protein